MGEDYVLGPCGWCGEQAVTEVILRKGRVQRKTVPVCERHARHFEKRDIDTVRVELDRKEHRERERKQWKKRARGS